MVHRVHSCRLGGAYKPADPSAGWPGHTTGGLLSPGPQPMLLLRTCEFMLAARRPERTPCRLCVGHGVGDAGLGPCCSIPSGREEL